MSTVNNWNRCVYFCITFSEPPSPAPFIPASVTPPTSVSCWLSTDVSVMPLSSAVVTSTGDITIVSATSAVTSDIFTDGTTYTAQQWYQEQSCLKLHVLMKDQQKLFVSSSRIHVSPSHVTYFLLFLCRIVLLKIWQACQHASLNYFIAGHT